MFPKMRTYELVTVILLAALSRVLEAAPIRGRLGYLGSPTDLDKGYSQAVYNMSMVQWERSELCRPGMFFLGG